MNKILMAIDGSTKSSGVAIFNMETKELIHYECITASSTNKIKRIDKMVENFVRLFNEYAVTKVIMEEPLPEDVKNNKQVFKALMYLQAETAIRFYNDFKYEFTNEDFIEVNHWRSICGIAHGKNGVRDSAKALDMAFVKKNYNIEANDDICDAICIGWAYLNESSPAPKMKLLPIGSEPSAF